MVMREKNLEEVYREWNTQISRHISGTLSKPTFNATSTFVTRLKELGGAASQEELKITMPTRFPGLYKEEPKKTRLDVDLNVASEVDKYIKMYRKSAENAVSNMRLSADAQGWSPKEFDRMMKALDNDARISTGEIKKLLEESTSSFKNAKSYEQVVAHATTLRGTLKELLIDMSPHLEEVARKEKMKPNLRTIEA
jgi:hypothetical protein